MDRHAASTLPREGTPQWLRQSVGQQHLHGSTSRHARAKRRKGAEGKPATALPCHQSPLHPSYLLLATRPTTACSATRRSFDSRPLLSLQQPACGEMALQAPSSLLRAPAPASPLRSSLSAPCSLRRLAPARRRVARAATAARITMRVASKQSYICRDCGYIYNDRTPFDKLADNYFCPVCGAPKRRFRPYEPAVSKNANSTDVRKARKEQLKKEETLGQALPIAIVAGIIALAGLYFYLNNVYT